MTTHSTKDYGDDSDNKLAEHVSTASLENVPTITRTRREPPELIKNMSLEERQHSEKALVRKIDLRLLPMIVLMYIINYLDRNNIAAARLAGLQDLLSKGGLDLTSTQYLTALSILFVGYILIQIPSNLFLNKIGKPALYLPTVMIVWGVISAATAGAQSYGGLIAIRFFLGFVEAAYFAGCLFFLSSWYTRKELGSRTALLYSGALISGAFSGLITAGIKNGLDGARGLRAWRWLFIIEGVITIFIAFCAYFALPNFPRTTSWLTEEERQLAIWRLDEDIGEDDWVDFSQQTFFHGMKLAVLDVKTWILVSLSKALLVSSTYNFLDGSTLWYRCIRDRYKSLSHCGCNSGLFRRRLSAPHGSSLYLSCYCILLQCLACRQNGRKILSYHAAVVFRLYYIHHCCGDYSNRAKILCYDAHARWSLCGLRGCVRVDLKHDTPTSCEGQLYFLSTQKPY